MNRADEAIDIVITWVDGADPQWQAKKAAAIRANAMTQSEAVSDARFRDWGLLPYWFRGIDAFAPWARTIWFVTEGHLPPWMDRNAPRLRVVRHEEFIPREYLPTFSSRTIELNLHRIPGLAERFVYCNDDMLLTAPTPSTHFFRNGLPAGVAVAKALHHGGITDHAALNAAHVLNRHFSKHRVIARAPHKWFHPRYGANVLRTLALLPWRGFTGFQQTHLPQAITASTMVTLWEREHAWLDRTCRQTFRDVSGLNPYVIDYWQLASGRFFPVSPRAYGTYRQLGVDDLAVIERDIREQRQAVLCINDGDVADVASTRDRLMHAFDAILPACSTFERHEAIR